MAADDTPRFGPSIRKGAVSIEGRHESVCRVSDIRRWKSAVLAEAGAAERVADIEAGLREATSVTRSTPTRQTYAQATDDINSEGV